MRLISWNCNGGFRKKATLLLQYEPDILVVPECENPSCYAFPVEMTEHYSSYWTGASAPKGLGLFVKKPLSPQSSDTLSPFRDFLPLRLKNCNLIGVWTHKPGYIEDVYDLLSTQHAKKHSCRRFQQQFDLGSFPRSKMPLRSCPTAK